jgi:hypothetical protein
MPHYIKHPARDRTPKTPKTALQKFLSDLKHEKKNRESKVNANSSR